MPLRTAEQQARIHLVLLLALTFTTGIADAVGYLGLDYVFTANMTGNVVILGMALVGGQPPGGGGHALPVIGPLIALFAFMLGAALAGRRLHRAPAGWTGRTTTMFLVTGLGILVLGLACAVEPPVSATVWGYAVTAGLALLMGIQAATARRLAVADVTTVVVTSTLTGLAADSRLAGGKGTRWVRRVLAVVLILAGATVGAAILHGGLAAGLIVPGVIVTAVAVIGHFSAHSGRPLGE
ncbi:YoaK family protein [Psychromicrobium xiongbiense]|uniref:YoaK family protein n=1 Tax=Psychromicrobium xiongbiense TaxID=3051184 RepID=UPI0025563137|nr:YoaK family protein [Psychromicrobium sp. YIM S02556]